MRLSNDNLYVLFICGALVLATGIVYWQVQQFEFVSIDDRTYVSNNEQVLNGLTREGFAWALTTMHAGNWHPLTWLSLMLDCELSESESRACHTTNVLFHIANTLLLFWVLKRMTGALWRSGFVAALFALHPLHVESVAWVSERKDVLSTFFWLLTMWAYVGYAEHRGSGRYVLVLLFFILGLMCKPVLVTLPFVLLLLDYWPMGRLQFKEAGDAAYANDSWSIGKVQRTTIRLITEKVPFFVLAAISCVVTFVAQKSSGSVSPMGLIPLNCRLINAVISYMNYVGKMIWPARLGVYYPHLCIWTLSQLLQAGAGLIVLSAVALWWGRRWRYLAMGWLWYIGTMLPVIGLVQVGGQAMADRYTYVPLIGLFIMISWGAADYMERSNYRRIVMWGPAAAIVLVLTVCTWKQVSYWRNSTRLLKHALAVTTNNAFASYNLGVVLEEKGEFEEAIVHYGGALKVFPDHNETTHSLVRVLVKSGRVEEAIEYYRDNKDLIEGDYKTDMSLGFAFESLGELDEAITHYRKAVEQRPDYFDARMRLGVMLGAQGKPDEAISHFRYVLQFRPNNALAHYNLGYALELQGKVDEAILHYQESIRIDPHNVQAQSKLKVLTAERDKSKQRDTGD